MFSLQTSCIQVTTGDKSDNRNEHLLILTPTLLFPQGTQRRNLSYISVPRTVLLLLSSSFAFMVFVL